MDNSLTTTAIPFSNPSTASNASSVLTSKGESSQVAAFVVIFILSVAGNSLVIAVVKRNVNGTLKTPTNVFIAHMAVADIVATLFGVPTMITRILLKGEWISGDKFGLVLCKIVPFLIETSFAVSALTITLIALERFLVVFYPTRKIICNAKACGVGVGLWIFAAIFYAPKLAAFSLSEMRGRAYCSTRKETIKPWGEIEAVLLVLILLLTLILYLAIICRVRCNRVTLLAASATKINRISKTKQSRERLNRRVLCQSLVIIFVHYLCWFPYLFVHLTCFYTNYTLAYCGNKILTSFLVMFFGYCNASANPFIYAILSENFRAGLKGIWRQAGKAARKMLLPDVPVRQRSRVIQLARRDNCKNGITKNGINNEPEKSKKASYQSPGEAKRQVATL
ncbi:predicted protein [Nematostella vectensis]|uniref:G-protein coupled receptors family 1 profile domain-containing protein n=1 Tax=Nematostella vectensis TaxID=45351 RepID=A7S552_NEMVE|nr:predicted protein [Nematostella vectensis]|eukprot:XP_001633246.1 predicted protein [Nematostella vectensis]